MLPNILRGRGRQATRFRAGRATRKLCGYRQHWILVGHFAVQQLRARWAPRALVAAQLQGSSGINVDRKVLRRPLLRLPNWRWLGDRRSGMVGRQRPPGVVLRRQSVRAGEGPRVGSMVVHLSGVRLRM